MDLKLDYDRVRTYILTYIELNKLDVQTVVDAFLPNMTFEGISATMKELTEWSFKDEGEEEKCQK